MYGNIAIKVHDSTRHDREVYHMNAGTCISRQPTLQVPPVIQEPSIGRLQSFLFGRGVEYPSHMGFGD